MFNDPELRQYDAQQKVASVKLPAIGPVILPLLHRQDRLDILYLHWGRIFTVKTNGELGIDLLFSILAYKSSRQFDGVPGRLHVRPRSRAHI